MADRVRIHGVTVFGVDVDERTGCAHYRSPRDVIAIAFPCCGRFHACHACHEALADHPAERWPRDRREAEAVLCGACGARLSIAEYIAAPDACPRCGTAFNPGCRNHHHLYFEAT